MIRPIDIVVPVYNARELLQRCLAALDRHTPVEQARILIVDDASPDPDIAPLLANWARTSPLRPRILVNAKNLGFVGSVNRGFAETESDVLLLNADTEVTPGWLAHLREALLSDERVATVTPFSNNAEICSWPLFCQVNPVPTDAEIVAAALASAKSTRLKSVV